jgi:hypothetical protein
VGARVAGEGVGVGADRAVEGGAALPRPAERGGAVRVAEARAAGLCGRQRLAGAARDGVAFGLGHQRHDADGQRVGVGHVGGNEVYTRIAQREQEGGIAGETVELGDDQRGPGQPREVEGFREFGAVGAAAALDLGEARENPGARAAAKASIAARCAARPRPLWPCRRVETRA